MVLVMILVSILDSESVVLVWTRFKAVWDETHLYIGAILESDFETQGTNPFFRKTQTWKCSRKSLVVVVLSQLQRTGSQCH